MRETPDIQFETADTRDTARLILDLDSDEEIFVAPTFGPDERLSLANLLAESEDGALRIVYGVSLPAIDEDEDDVEDYLNDDNLDEFDDDEDDVDEYLDDDVDSEIDELDECDDSEDPTCSIEGLAIPGTVSKQIAQVVRRIGRDSDCRIVTHRVSLESGLTWIVEFEAELN